MKKFSVVLALCTLLAACGGLLRSHEAPVLVYTPAPAPVAAESPLPTLASVLVVARPEPGPGLDADYITVALPDHRLDTIAGARWSAPVPELVQSYLVRSLSARNGWRAVLSDRSAFNGAYLLQTEIRSYTAEYSRRGQPPLVRVWLHAELGRAQDRELLRSMDARGEAQASEDRQTSIVAAFEVALASAARALAEQSYAACAEADAARAATQAPAPP